MQRFTIPRPGGHVAGLNFGRPSGPIDLIFLHATGFCALTYRTLLQRLGSERRAVALDLRGHGHTTLPAHPFKLTDWYGYAADVVAIVRHLSAGLPTPRLIAGHSMGGTVSLLALSAEPALAAALLMIDPPFVTPQMRRKLLLPFGTHLMRRRLPIARGAARRRREFPSAEAVLASYTGRGAFKTWQPGFLQDYVEDGFVRRADGAWVLRCSPAWESATFASQRHDVAAALRALKVPARVLLAEHGSTAARSSALMHACAPHLVQETVAGSSHFLPMEQPELVCQRMLAMM
jgi:pimeloyl-ACP methyl ester carboxylesterase